MARQQQDQDQVGRQEGGRWINRKPDGEELAKWFSENVFLHDGMSHAPFLPGLTLIPNKERVKEVRLGDGGQPQLVDVDQLVYAPYPKVETRVDYWWKWRLQHPEWEAQLKPVAREKPSGSLPDGFWQMPVEDMAGKTTPFIAVSYHAVMYERRRNGGLIVEGYGTKVVPLLVRRWNGQIVPDENAIAKAETGAKGRALGAAGILIIPGAGIATAEDMLEFIGGSEEPAPSLPAVEPPADGDALSNAPVSISAIIAGLTQRLQSEFPAAYEEARAWAHEKGYDIEHPPETALRGLERTLRRKLEAAERQSTVEQP